MFLAKNICTENVYQTIFSLPKASNTENRVKILLLTRMDDYINMTTIKSVIELKTQSL